MKQKQNETIVTTAGVIEVVKLEDFVAKIPVERATNLISQYNALTSVGNEEDNAYEGPDGLPKEEDSTYIRTYVLMEEPSKLNNLLHILNQTNTVEVKGETKDERIENAALMSMENFGAPTHLVEITYNCYGLFCLDDFKYKILSPAHAGIVCYAPRRNLVFRVTNW